ncbi:MAG: Trm112 family protein [Pseudomonadota bacterium]
MDDPDTADRKQKLTVNALDAKMLSLLVCPLTKQPLHFDDEACELISEVAKLAYPVRGGIAIMLPSEARALDDDA